MSIRLIASVVIAALLLTGTASAVPPNSEYGAQTPQTTALLTAQEAQDIALQHAGLTADTVTGLRSEFDADERVPEWDIAWRSGNWEYDYSVDAETGAIRDWEKEYDPIRAKEPAPTEPAPTEPTPTEPTPTEPVVTEPVPAESVVTTLAAQEAQAIALAHAGLSADAVTALRSKFDVDDGAQEWEIEWRSGDWEYDYTVHAETGEVLKWDKEYDPEKQPVVTEPEPVEPAPTQPAATPLTAEEAQAIALQHAGLTADQVNGLRSEYDVDDGVSVYEIEWRCGRWEYEYEIHAETGAILDWEKDD